MLRKLFFSHWAEQVIKRATRWRLLSVIIPMVLMAAAPALAQQIRHVIVECHGACNKVTLGQACGAGWNPVAVDCEKVTDSFLPGSPCGSGAAKCSRLPVKSTDVVSFYCQDTSGADANVYCTQ